jgi:cytochrome P450
VETFGSMTVAQAAFVSLLQYLPMSLIRWIFNKAPSDDLEHVRKTNVVSNKILLQFIDEKRSMGAEGKNDMMSNILRAGLSEDPSSRLTDQEIVSQLR